MRRLGVIAGAVTVLVLGAAAVQAAIPDEDGYTYICVNTSSGAIMAREKGAGCPKNSTASRLVANQHAIPVTTYYTSSHTAVIPPFGMGNAATVTAFCNEGDEATGGGYFKPQLIVGIEEQSSRPVDANSEHPAGWSVFFSRTKQPPDNAPDEATTYVRCAHTE
jgi:hypothetical protein